MRELIKKYKKLFIMLNIVIITLVIYFSFSLLRNNLNRIVKLSLKQALNYNVEFSAIKFKNLNTIEIEEFQLKNTDNKEIVIESPYLTINLNFREIFKGYIIESIVVNGGYTNIRVYDINKVNIIDATVGDNQTLPPESVQVKGLKKIIAKDVTVNFTDISYKNPIQRIVKNVNGEVNYVGMMNLNFRGYTGENLDEYIYYGFTPAKGALETTLKIQNFTVDSTISQYSGVGDIFEVTSGKADLEFEFNKYLQMYGGGKITDFSAREKQYGFEVENGNAEFLFQDEYIEINAVADFADNKIEANINKIGKDVNTNIKGKNINIQDMVKGLPANSVQLPDLFGVISYFDLTFQGKVNDPKSVQGKGYVRSRELNINQINYVTDLRGAFSFTNDLFAVDDLEFKAEINELDDFPIEAKFLLNGKYEGNNSTVNYNFENINSFAEFDRLEGSVEYNFDSGEIKLSNKTEKLSGEVFYSNDGQIKLKFDFNEYSLKYDDEEIYKFNGNILLDYNYKNRNLAETKIDFKIKNGYYFDDLILNANNNNGELKINEFLVTSNESYANFSGNINLKDLSYEVLLNESALDTENLYYLKDIENLEFNGNIKSQINGDQNNLTAKVELYSEKGAYNFQYEKLKSKIELNYDFNNEKPLEFESKSSVRLFKYDEIYFRDLVFDVEYLDDTLIINKVLNNLLTISGEYNIMDSLFTINYKLNDYNLNRIDSLKNNQVSGEIEKLEGQLTGNVDDFRINFDLNNSFIKYNDGQATSLSGSVEYFANNLKLKDVRINKNLLNGNIDIKNKELDINLKFFEEELYKYYNYPDLKYRVIGELNTWGEWENLKGIAKVNLDKIYFRGESIPDLTFELSYNSGDVNNLLSKGLVSLNKLIVHNKDGKEISGINGYFNFETQKFKLSLSKDDLAIEDLSYIITPENITGIVRMNLNLEGKLNEILEYRVEIESEGIDYQNIHIDNFNFLVLGNDERIDLKYLNFKYGENMLNGFGQFSFEDESYQLRLKGEDIDLVFLNIFQTDLINDVKGLLTIDLDINEKENIGVIELKDFYVSDKEERFKLEAFSGEINFKNDVFRIGDLSGKVNKGDVFLNGYWKIPKLSLDLFRTPNLLFEDYELKLYADGLNYFDEYMNLTIDTELDLSTTEIKGDLVIQSGEIYKLPSIDDTSTEFGARRDLFLDKINIDIDVTVSDQVVVRIEELSDEFAFVRDLELGVEGSGTVTVEEGKINFVGSFDSSNGALTFNNTILKIDSASLVFENKNEYFPDVNPYIAINSETEVSGEEIYVAINGYYKTMQLRLSSESGLSEQDISSLLLFQKTFDDTETSEVVREILDTQLSATIFSPLSSEMERIFDISNVSITSKLLTEGEGDTYRVTEDLILGAVLELSDPIYKDKVFWNIKSEFSETESGKVDNYDLWISYKINNNTSWKTGLKKDTELETDRLDFHIDLDFKYKVDSFFSILEFITK